MDTYTAVLELIKAGAAVGAVVIAGFGLHTWRRQLRGTVQYDTARRLYRAVLEVRDATAYVRSPLITLGEMQTAYKDAGVEPEGGDVTKDKRTDEMVYDRRWSRLNKTRTTLGAELLEAEVLWGGTALRDAQRDLNKCLSELYVAVIQHLRGSTSQLSQEKYEHHIDLLYDASGAEPDEFAKRVGEAVASFERAVKPHLGRP